MSYTKQTWQSGDVITAAKLNHIEEGLKNANSLPAVTRADLGKTIQVVEDNDNPVLQDIIPEQNVTLDTTNNNIDYYGTIANYNNNMINYIEEEVNARTIEETSIHSFVLTINEINYTNFIINIVPGNTYLVEAYQDNDINHEGDLVARLAFGEGVNVIYPSGSLNDVISVKFALFLPGAKWEKMNPFENIFSIFFYSSNGISISCNRTFSEIIDRIQNRIPIVGMVQIGDFTASLSLLLTETNNGEIVSVQFVTPMCFQNSIFYWNIITISEEGCNLIDISYPAV